MVKKSIIAVVVVFLLAAVFVSGYTRWGSTSYGAVYYYGQPFYNYYPVTSYPQQGAYYPYYSYPSYTQTAYQSYPQYNYPSYTQGTYAQQGVYYPHYYTTYPQQVYQYYSPSSTDYRYTRGAQVAYPSSAAYPSGISRGFEGQMCGLVEGQQFGCQYGLVCDYTKANQTGIGVCSQQSTYPYYI